MNFFERVKSRVQEDGVMGTLRYGAYVTYDTIAAMVQDASLDLKYSGTLLIGNEKTRFKDLGANDVYHTDYSAMPLIFQNIPIHPNDVLVDVGCGKGRVINYWLSKYTNPIIGLELDPALASHTDNQFAHRPNVQIIQGDAIANLPSHGTIFYFYNPFEAQKVRDFAVRMKDISQQKTITIIYYNPKSLHAFTDDLWNINYIDFEQHLGIKRWGRINKYHDLAIITRRPASQLLH
jgi:hypothetical protein